MNTDVESTLATYPVAVQSRLLAIRKLIFQVASDHKVIGEIKECLKWGEPAYLTSTTKSGTTIRLAWKSKAPDEYRLLVNCQTDLIDTCRTLYPHLSYDGNRAIRFHLDDEPPTTVLLQIIEMALTYHINKKPSSKQVRK